MLSEPGVRGSGVGPNAGLSFAPAAGSGGWFWPIGTEDFHGWDGWLEPRGAYVHVAQDMPCRAGQAVYAVGDGVVFIARADAGGYGVGGRPGGCVIVTHVTASGIAFHALYGHVSGIRVKEGQRVAAGQVIAKVNGCRHLHFSVHPGEKYRDGNPYAGHVPRRWKDHGGFVDPVRFLTTNPRAAAYAPPAVPSYEIETGAPPERFGAADGVAYWTESGEAGTVTWRCRLATGERRALREGEEPPDFDAVRYTAALLAAPAVGFAVADHLPVATLVVRHSTPAWGQEAQLTLTLANATGGPLRGALVTLQRREDGRWADVVPTVTGRDGRADFAVAPEERTSLRAVFTPADDPPGGRVYVAARSRTLEVTPHVALSLPRLPAVVSAETTATVSGFLTPAHAAGRAGVLLAFQRRGAGGAWVAKTTVAAADEVAGARTRYRADVVLSAPGRWRVQAVHRADGVHARSYSAWSHFTVD